jgi:membrane protease YdiL (CAAX protease family)
MITSIIRKLPPPAEFCLVVLVCFWWAIYASIVAIAHHPWSTTSQAPEHFTGIGIELGEKDHKVIIVRALPNTPASGAGLAYGLVIQKIDGTSTDCKSLQQCADLGRGPAGSKVKYELVDPTRNQTNTVELTRATILDTSQLGRVTNRSALRVAILELLGLAVTFWIARTRGWPLAAWGFQPSWKSIGAGIILCLVTVLVLSAIIALANVISPGSVDHRHSVSQLSLSVLITFAMINPVFEEIIEAGYFVQSLQRFGMCSAVLMSAVFRAFLHAYQGIDAVVLIFPLGLIFGFLYWKWRRLWPLFIAHILLDLTAYFPR